MKKMFKKICTAALSCVLISGSFITSHASVETVPEDTENTEQIISENLASLLDDYIMQDDCFDRDDLETMYLLDAVSFTDSEELSECVDAAAYSGDSESDYPVTHIPIVINGEVALIFDIIETDNGYCTTIGPDFAPLLNAVLQSGEDDMLLVQDGFTLYGITSDDAYAYENDSVFEVEPAGIIDSYTDIDLSEFSAAIPEVNSSYTEAAVSSLESESEDTLTVSSTVTGTKFLSDYPIVGQTINGESRGMCWAATVASIARFEKPSYYSNLTAKMVCDYMGIGYDDGGTNREAKSALSHYLGSDYSLAIRGVLSTSKIQTIINNDDPAYMQCKRKVSLLNYKYHAVALIGYKFNSSTTAIRIMDPAYPKYKLCTYDGSNWTFTFGDHTYTWIKTIKVTSS